MHVDMLDHVELKRNLQFLSFSDVDWRVPKPATSFKFAPNMTMPAFIMKMRQWRLNFRFRGYFDIRFVLFNHFTPSLHMPLREDKDKVLKYLDMNVLQCY